MSKVIALISGGIDSPVAAWLVREKGVEIVPLFMNPQPLVDERTVNRAEETIKRLAAGRPLKTYIIPYGDVLIELLKEGDKLGCVLCKRMIYRVANLIAEKEGATAIVTGESIGQVASQTMQNLYAIDKASQLPVLRPLIAMDKMEIVALAKKIGTYDASIMPANCCLGPPLYPETKASLEGIQRVEEKLDIEGLAKKAVEEARVVYLQGDGHLQG
jgi:thiamine biosynthesis protein ThiI